VVEVVGNVFGYADFAVVQLVEPGQLLVPGLVCAEENDIYFKFFFFFFVFKFNLWTISVHDAAPIEADRDG
jgi:hypothetical protein